MSRGTETRQRTHQVGVRLLPDEHARVMEVVNRTGLSRQEALRAPFSRDPDDHDWGRRLDSALVLTLVNWKVECDARPAHGEGSDCSDLMDEALTRIKGLCAGIFDPDEVMDEIES